MSSGAIVSAVWFTSTSWQPDEFSHLAVVRFYNKRGTAEQWIKEGKQAAHWTRLSCHRFRANEVRLQLSVLAYNLGNLWRRLVLPMRIDAWSLTSLQQRLVKTGGRLGEGRPLLVAPARQGSSDSPPVRGDAPAHLGAAGSGQLTADSGSNQSRAKKGCNARRVSEKYQRNHPVCSNSAADCELYDGPSD